MKTLLSDKAYEVLKWLCVLALPANSDFVKFLLPTWNIPYGDPIAETLRQIALLIGVLIGISTIQYNKQSAEINADIKDFTNEEK